ncbi:polyprenyl synthetase family protein [Clostridium paraputrificum]|uniref:polyprenyl synthetase family protein n=1 Tax=Clostridium TaxID=1485 RepID=UPI003D34F60E
MKIDELKQEIESYLDSYFKNKGSYNKLIYEASSYSLNIGGKRIRPILLLLTYNLYKGDYSKVIPMASAIEMIHTYSLIHDDLPAMDNDDLRRGKPTNHKVFGENIAILAGDTLLNEAMSLMIKFSLENGVEALRASKEIAEAAGANGMIGGQVVDILSEKKEVVSEEELEYMHLKKTGELIRSSIVAGAILGGAPESDIEKLNLFGIKLGLAFQIKDDILDIIGSVEKLGKNTNKDGYKNKFNFITMYGLEKCKEKCKLLTDESIELLSKLTVNDTYLKELTYSLLDREY